LNKNLFLVLRSEEKSGLEDYILTAHYYIHNFSYSIDKGKEIK